MKIFEFLRSPVLVIIVLALLPSGCKKEVTSEEGNFEEQPEERLWEAYSLQQIPKFHYDQFLSGDSCYAYGDLKLCIGYGMKEGTFLVLDENDSILFEHSPGFIEWIMTAFRETKSQDLLVFIEEEFEAYSGGCTVYRISKDTIRILGELTLAGNWQGECLAGLYEKVNVSEEDGEVYLTFETDSLCIPYCMSRIVEGNEVAYRFNEQKPGFDLYIKGEKCLENGMPVQLVPENVSQLWLLHKYTRTDRIYADINKDEKEDLILLLGNNPESLDQLIIYLSNDKDDHLNFYSIQRLSSSNYECDLSIDTIQIDSTGQITIQPYFFASIGSSWSGSTKYYYNWDGADLILTKQSSFSMSRNMGTRYETTIDYQKGVIIKEQGNEFYPEDPLNQTKPDTSVLDTVEREKLLLKNADPFIDFDCEVFHDRTP